MVSLIDIENVIKEPTSDYHIILLILPPLHLFFLRGGVGLAYIHSNLPNIMFVATRVHVILRWSTMLTWMHDNRELM